MMPRVLVVDDDTLYAEAATAILDREGRFDVVGRAAEDGPAVHVSRFQRSFRTDQ